MVTERTGHRFGTSTSSGRVDRLVVRVVRSSSRVRPARVNLEVDMIARYLACLLEAKAGE